MILVHEFTKFLKDNKINFFTGVPDSCLKELTTYLDKVKKKNHLIAVNEGNAVGIGIGYYLSKKEIPLVYMQNSGLGNAINPLISIAHKKVYSIPLFLLIGWRGSKDKYDEPQHVVKGKITPALLKLLNINYCVLKNKNDFKKIKKLIKKSKIEKKPIACLVEKNIFKTKSGYIQKKISKTSFLRKDFLSVFLDIVPNNVRIISTTGYTSRELFQLRRERKNFKGKDFYMVGGMGHSTSVSLGYSLNSKKNTICLDGDGSLLMHLGSLRNLAYFGKSNLKHILINNNAHESVGGQKTSANGINFMKLVKSLGYKNYFKISKKNETKKMLNKLFKSKGPSFLEVKVGLGAMENLIRPKNLLNIKNKFTQ